MHARPARADNARVEAPFKPGDVLAGRYRVERILGAGGMGVVALAQHLLLGERVAIKCLLTDLAGSGEMIARFQREAKSAAKIQSEHVARVTDFGVLADGSPFLVMEYLEGHDLAEELRTRGPLPLEEAVEYVLQASVGVAEAHALGIVHRDLKPSNLFLARLPNGRKLVKVLDFGIAKQMGDAGGTQLTGSFSMLGSIAYMSPEQLESSRTVDARTDVWALGVVLFELLTGRFPFEAETATGMVVAITTRAPQAPRALRRDVPAELERVILHCLEKDREQRIRSLSALATALVPFGGWRADMLAGRVAGALGSEWPPRPDLSGAVSIEVPPAAPVPASVPETPLAPSWSPTAIDRIVRPEFVRTLRRNRLRIALGASITLLAAIAWTLSRSTGSEPPPALATPATPATEAPPPAAPAAITEPSRAPAAREQEEAVPFGRLSPTASEPTPEKPAATLSTPAPTRPAAATRAARRARSTASTATADVKRPIRPAAPPPKPAPQRKLKGPTITDL